MWGKARRYGMVKAKRPEAMFIRTFESVFTFRRNAKGKVIGFTETTPTDKFAFVRSPP
jgi:hypothetical protein